MEENTKGILGIPTNPNMENIKRGNNYLLVIGIDNYVHCPKLNNAVNDAEGFVKLLTERYDFKSVHTKTLLNEEATCRRIIAEFRALAQKVTPADNLIIYFSGHGEFDKVLQQGYWIPVDAEKGDILERAGGKQGVIISVTDGTSGFKKVVIWQRNAVCTGALKKGTWAYKLKFTPKTDETSSTTWTKFAH